MNIALTGASGFIGSQIAKAAHAKGHSVTALVRETSRRGHIEPVVERFVVGNQDDENAWPALLEGADVVIHNSTAWSWKGEIPFDQYVRSNLNGSLGLLKASAPKPFVFMSTIGVHHDMRERWGGRIDEDHPSRPPNAYGAYKASVEMFLWAEHAQTGRAFSAIRPCGVYGIDPKLERSMGFPIIKKISAGQKFTRAGGGKFVHVDDVVAATLHAAEDTEGAERVVNLVDCYARWADWAQIAAELLGVEAEIDFSSRAQPKNQFLPDVGRRMGAGLDRGHEGIRAHLRELIDAMRDAGEL